MKKKWWHDKVAYQIYPKSFFDTNQDGIGDLRGITEKLDYLKNLGIDIIWISPVYQSPFVDQGYDISDYYAIDPAFGTMEDMDRLIAEAKKRDMYIVMDLVVNHCSSQHEWFRKAVEDPHGKYGNYFYIKEGKDGNPPCNWRSYFGGSVWEKLPGHDNLYYLHLFAKEQPDLNWENPELRQEIYKMIRWWLEKGIAGFRLDAIINIKKDLRFQSFPADREDGLSSFTCELEQAEGIHEFLQEMKEEAFAPYNAFTIGELFDYRPEELEQYIGDDGCFESIFDFSTHLLGSDPRGWYAFTPVTPEEYKKAVFDSKRRTWQTGFMANIIENHDEPRGVSHYIREEDLNEISKKMLAGITMMQYGLPFLYQGQEIGMSNTVFSSIDEVDDISTIDEYRNAREQGLSEVEALKAVAGQSRDNARTPVQWDASENAGFTSAVPWRKVNPNYKEINVAEQEGRPGSVLEFYKELIRLRKNPVYQEAVVYGEEIPFRESEENLMAFYRKGREKTLLVLANWQRESRTVEIPLEFDRVLVNNTAEKTQIENGKVFMSSYQFLVLEKE